MTVDNQLTPVKSMLKTVFGSVKPGTKKGRLEAYVAKRHGEKGETAAPAAAPAMTIRMPSVQRVEPCRKARLGEGIVTNPAYPGSGRPHSIEQPAIRSPQFTRHHLCQGHIQAVVGGIQTVLPGKSERPLVQPSR